MQYLVNLWNALDFGSLRDMVLRLVSVFVCLTIHETCHGVAALALGDPTAKQQHRLSLNPLRHIDWVGLIMMMVAGFGWAKPVPVNPNYFKKPKQGMALTALAGPVSNFILALLLLLGVKLMMGQETYSEFSWQMLDFMVQTAALSIGLGIFNLLPIPPLDGSKVLFALLPDSKYEVLMRYERIGMILLLGLSVVGVGGSWLTDGILWVFDLFCRMVGV